MKLVLARMFPPFIAPGTVLQAAGGKHCHQFYVAEGPAG